MSEDALPGYRGDLRKALDEAGAEIGDKLEIVMGGNHQYTGSVMPRVETYDDWHLILKLKSGYNVGIAYDKTMKITKVGQAEQDQHHKHRGNHSQPRRLHHRRSPCSHVQQRPPHNSP